MEIVEVLKLVVSEPTQAGEVRRAATALAQELGFDEEKTGRVGIIASEIAGNLAKHAEGGGVVLLRRVNAGQQIALELIALDRGPGIRDVSQALRDGYSTSGTAGTGLGAVSRLSDVFQIHSAPGIGTAILARVWLHEPPQTQARFVVGGVQQPVHGETESGDAWSCAARADGVVVMLADGLGHGPLAARAAAEIVRAFREHAQEMPARLLERMHAAARSTRGAAVAIAEIAGSPTFVRYAGVGNISGAVVHARTVQNLVSHNGIVGAEMPRVQEFQYDWPAPHALLVMHSDGLSTHWSLDRYPGLAARDPSLIAAVLYRDFARGRDDVTVVVVQGQE